MTRLLRIGLPVVLALLVGACGGSDSTTSACPALGVDEVLAAPILNPSGTWDVTYTATVTGAPSVTQLQYRDTSGALQTVNNPTFPFTYTMSGKPAGTRVTLAATASAPPGTVSLEVVALSGPPNAQERYRWASSCGP